MSYASGAERSKAANADFTRIADKYSFTRNGRIARYFEGITLRDMGDNSGAEKQLQQVAGSRDKEVASLAKLALASLYQDANKTQQAIDLYKSLMEKPTTSVGKSTAQFELANLYEINHQPLEARKLYEQMQKDNPTSQIGQVAAQKLQTLRPPQAYAAVAGCSYAIQKPAASAAGFVLRTNSKAVSGIMQTESPRG